MRKSYGRSLLLLSAWGASLFSAPYAEATDKALKCQPLIFSEYCFPGGSFHDLVPLDRIEAQLNKKAHELKAERRTPSALPAWRRQELAEMWAAALSTVFDYVDTHSVKLTESGVISPESVVGKGPQGPAFLEAGPLLRLTLTEDEENAFRLKGSIQIHEKRALAAIFSNQADMPLKYRVLLGTWPLIRKNVRQKGAYIDLDELLALPFIKPVAKVFSGSKVGILELLGAELVLSMVPAVEEQIRGRNRNLNHSIHFYADGTGDVALTGSPQVLFTGELMLPDTVVAAFSDQELMLLMLHEAMHLAKPNFFMVVSVADLIQREHFPEFQHSNASPLIANFLGRNSSAVAMNCPVDIAHDDELIIDLFVFKLLREKPALAQAYNALLKRLHSEFDPGHVSRMSYRVRHGNDTIDEFENGAERSHNGEIEAKLFRKSMMSMFLTRGPSYLAGEELRMEHLLQEMARHPELKHDVRSLQIVLEYYKNNAFLSDNVKADTKTKMPCRDVSRMWRTDE
ncbi:hypothetical protein WNZ15_24015 [Roseibium sp. AS2]|uniref:hypothetical protein n=1 Tax=Roseibium sp. AS2 TaxID=3135781 RepID=UPI00317582A6